MKYFFFSTESLNAKYQRRIFIVDADMMSLFRRKRSKVLLKIQFCENICTQIEYDSLPIKHWNCINSNPNIVHLIHFVNICHVIWFDNTDSGIYWYTTHKYTYTQIYIYIKKTLSMRCIYRFKCHWHYQCEMCAFSYERMRMKMRIQIRTHKRESARICMKIRKNAT